MKKIKNNQGFTLLEMLIVLFVVAVLMLLIIPNINATREKIDKQGTEALASVIQTQATLYQLENKTKGVSLDALLQGGYLSQKQVEEAAERQISLSGDGNVSYPK